MSTNDDAWRRPPGDTVAGSPPPAQPSRPPASQPQQTPQTPRTPRPEDAAWARPPGGAVPDPDATSPTGGAASPEAGVADAASGIDYTGPPPTNPPPPNWRPPLVAEPNPPGTLPEQDHDRIDVEEQAARTLTTGIGLVAGAILLVLLLVLCARAVF